MRSDLLRFAALLLALVPASAIADAPTPSPTVEHDSKLCTSQPMFPQCGILGPPCCLGKQLLMPMPGPPLHYELEYAVDVLGRVAARDPDEARFQLAKLRAATAKRNAARLESLLRKDPRLAAIL